MKMRRVLFTMVLMRHILFATLLASALAVAPTPMTASAGPGPTCSVSMSPDVVEPGQSVQVDFVVDGGPISATAVTTVDGAPTNTVTSDIESFSRTFTYAEFLESVPGYFGGTTKAGLYVIAFHDPADPTGTPYCSMSFRLVERSDPAPICAVTFTPNLIMPGDDFVLDIETTEPQLPATLTISRNGRRIVTTTAWLVPTRLDYSYDEFAEEFDVILAGQNPNGLYVYELHPYLQPEVEPYCSTSFRIGPEPLPTSPTTTPRSLPETGVDNGPTAALGAALVAAGVGAVVLARRRRPAQG